MGAEVLRIGWGAVTISAVVELVEGEVNIEKGAGFPACESMAQPPRKEKMLLIKIQKRKPNFSGFMVIFL